VWQLYAETLALTGPLPTLLERDNDIPPFAILLAEVQQAQRHLDAATAAMQQREAVPA
jgi:uncharacterized protein